MKNRNEIIKVIKDYLDLCDEDPEIHNGDNKERADYILGCMETWGVIEENIWSKDEVK